MKKIGKVLLAFLLIIGTGFTGFTLGKNSSNDNRMISEQNQKHMASMEAMKELIDENFLFDYEDKQLYDGSLKGMFEIWAILILLIIQRKNLTSLWKMLMESMRALV